MRNMFEEAEERRPEPPAGMRGSAPAKASERGAVARASGSELEERIGGRAADVRPPSPAVRAAALGGLGVVALVGALGAGGALLGSGDDRASDPRVAEMAASPPPPDLRRHDWRSHALESTRSGRGDAAPRGRRSRESTEPEPAPGTADQGRVNRRPQGSMPGAPAALPQAAPAAVSAAPSVAAPAAEDATATSTAAEPTPAHEDPGSDFSFGSQIGVAARSGSGSGP